MKFIKRSLYVIIIQGGLMKKLYKSLVFIFSMAILFSGCEKDKPKVNKDEDSVVMKTDEQIYDENLTDDFFDLLDDANKDLSDEDKTFLAKILKDIENKDVASLSKILAEPLKSQVGGDLRVLSELLLPVDYTGPILSIDTLTKKDDSFLVIGECEDDSLTILANKKDDKLSGLEINLLSTLSKNKELEENNQAFVDKSYRIIDSLREVDKEVFREDVKGLGLEGEDFDKMYEGLKGDLDLAGQILSDKSKVEVSFARDQIKTAPVDQNLVDVTLVFTFENIEKIVYDFTYTEDLDLISLELSSEEE